MQDSTLQHYANDTTQYNTVQYNTIRYNTIQYNTIQYNTIQYNTIQYNTKNLIKFDTVQYYTVFYKPLTEYTTSDTQQGGKTSSMTSNIPQTTVNYLSPFLPLSLHNVHTHMHIQSHSLPHAHSLTLVIPPPSLPPLLPFFLSFLPSLPSLPSPIHAHTHTHMHTQGRSSYKGTCSTLPRRRIDRKSSRMLLPPSNPNGRTGACQCGAKSSARYVRMNILFI